MNLFSKLNKIDISRDKINGIEIYMKKGNSNINSYYIKENTLEELSKIETLYFQTPYSFDYNQKMYNSPSYKE